MQNGHRFKLLYAGVHDLFSFQRHLKSQMFNGMKNKTLILVCTGTHARTSFKLRYIAWSFYFILWPIVMNSIKYTHRLAYSMALIRIRVAAIWFHYSNTFVINAKSEAALDSYNSFSSAQTHGFGHRVYVNTT